MKLGRMKILAELLKDPNPKLAAKMRRAARAIGEAAAMTLVKPSRYFGFDADLLRDDPVCPKACGRCHWCLRRIYGPDYPFTMPHATPPDRRRR